MERRNPFGGVGGRGKCMERGFIRPREISPAYSHGESREGENERLWGNFVAREKEGKAWGGGVLAKLRLTFAVKLDN